MRAEAGRKDRLPRLLATTSVDIKRHRFSGAETGGGRLPTARFAAVKPLLNQQELEN